MYLISLFFINLFFVNGQVSHGDDQVYIPSFVTSPNVSNLQGYLDTNISYNTGTTNFSIPLYELNLGNIKVPISISYNTKGIKVEQESSSVGLGWSLFVGGNVNRKINGIIDDFKSPNFDYCGGTMYSNLKLRDLAKIENPKEIQHLVICQQTAEKDFQLDQFSYSIPEGSGHFLYDQDTNQFIENEKSLNVLLFNKFLNSYQISDWEITSSIGNIYKFGEDNNRFDISNLKYSESNHRIVNSLDLTPITFSEPKGISTWHLKSIKDINNNIVSFNYFKNPITYYNIIPREGNKSNNIDLKKYYTSSMINEMLIESINFEHGKISFFYENRIDLEGAQKLTAIKVFSKINNQLQLIKEINFLYSYFDSKKTAGLNFNENADFINKRLRLDKVIFKNFEDSPKKDEIYQFTYNPELLPQKFSYSQDYWGYYNGESNHSLFPTLSFKTPPPINSLLFDNGNERAVNDTFSKAAILEKVQFPTGGYSKFAFESNKIKEELTMYDLVSNHESNLSSLSNIAKRNIRNTYKILITKHDKLDEDSEIIEITSNKIQYNKYLDTKGKDIYKIDTEYFEGVCPLGSIPIGEFENVPLHFENLYCGIFHKIDYDDIKKQYFSKVTINASDDIIKKFLSHINFDAKINIKYNSNPLIKNVGGLRVKTIENYDHNNVLINKKEYEYEFDEYSEGGISFLPQFGIYEELILLPNINVATIPKNLYFSTEFNLLPSTFDVLHYPKVREKFINVKNNELFYTDYLYDNNPYTRTPPLFDTPNTFRMDIGATSSERINKLVEKRDFKGNEKSKVTKNNTSFTNIKYIYNGINQYNIAQKLGPASSIGTQYINISYSTVTSTSTKKRIIDTIFFDKNNIIMNNIDYEYSKNNPLLISKQTTQNSKGEILSTEYQYPPDLTSGYEQSSIMQEMVKRNIIATPVITKSKNDSTVLSEQRNLYKYFPGTSGNLILPEFVYQKKGAMPAIANVADRKITYNNYDNQGNLTQYTLENGIPVSIIWGYNGQYPIAKIEGTAYNQISIDFIKELQNLSNQDNDRCYGLDGSCKESNLRKRLNEFRSNGLFTNSMVSVYTYDPLVGVTSIMQPNGQTEYYNYDSSNRLQSIVNDKKEVLKTFEYNYRQP